MTRARSVILIAPVLLACAASAQQPATPATPPPPPAAPVPTMSLSGQNIAVMPITMVVADPALASDSLYAPWRDHRTALSTADSLIGDGGIDTANGGAGTDTGDPSNELPLNIP